MAMLAVFPPFVLRIRRSSKRALRDRDLVCEAAKANGGSTKEGGNVNSSRGTNDRNTDKGEVGGSSPPRPTINPQCLCGDSHFCRLAHYPSRSHLPTICQLSDWLYLARPLVTLACVCILLQP